jgi:hypothetical protein
MRQTLRISDLLGSVVTYAVFGAVFVLFVGRLMQWQLGRGKEEDDEE